MCSWSGTFLYIYAYAYVGRASSNLTGSQDIGAREYNSDRARPHPADYALLQGRDLPTRVQNAMHACARMWMDGMEICMRSAAAQLRALCWICCASSAHTHRMLVVSPRPPRTFCCIGRRPKQRRAERAICAAIYARQRVTVVFVWHCGWVVCHRHATRGCSRVFATHILHITFPIRSVAVVHTSNEILQRRVCDGLIDTRLRSAPRCYVPVQCVAVGCLVTI